MTRDSADEKGAARLRSVHLATWSLRAACLCMALLIGFFVTGWIPLAVSAAAAALAMVVSGAAGLASLVRCLVEEGPRTCLSLITEEHPAGGAATARRSLVRWVVIFQLSVVCGALIVVAMNGGVS